MAKRSPLSLTITYPKSGFSHNHSTQISAIRGYVVKNSREELCRKQKKKSLRASRSLPKLQLKFDWSALIHLLWDLAEGRAQSESVSYLVFSAQRLIAL